MAMVDTDNQRRHLRRPFDGAVKVDGHAARGVDVSMGGMRVEQVDPAPELGRVVMVEFVLPGGGPVATPAEVVRVQDGIYVLRFVRLAPINLVELSRFTSSEG